MVTKRYSKKKMKFVLKIFIVFCALTTFRPRHTKLQKPYTVLSDSLMNHGQTMTNDAHILQTVTDGVDTFYINIMGRQRDTIR